MNLSFVSGRIRGGPGEGKDKFCAHAFGADYVDVFPVGLDSFFYNGKSQAGAFFILAPGQICFVETLPDLVQSVSGNTDAVILYRNVDFFAPFGGLDGDSGFRVAELDGIVQKVVEHLVDLALVRVDCQMFGGKEKFDGYFFLGTGAFKRGGCIFYDLVDVKFLPVQQDIFAVELIESQKILGQVCQSFCLKQDDLQIFFVHFRGNGAVCHGFDISLDGSQRGAEVVGDVGHKFFLIVLNVLQLGGHVVQRSGEIAHLVFSADRDLVVQIAGGILGGGFCNLAKGPVDKDLKAQQDHKGQQEDHEERNVGRAHQDILKVLDVRGVFVDQKIALGRVAVDHRHHDGDHFFVKVRMVGADLVAGAAALGGIKVCKFRRGGRVALRLCCCEHVSVPGEKPCGSIQLRLDARQLQMDVVERQPSAKIRGQIVVGHQTCLLVHSGGNVAQERLPGQAGGQGGGGKQTKKAEYNI